MAPDCVTPSVLLVDDDAAVLRALERCLLHRCDLCVVVSLSPAMALEELDRQSFSVIVTDAALPVLSGPVLLSIAEKRWPGMWRVLYTGQVGTGEYIPGAEHADRVIGKGESPSVAAKAICKLAHTEREPNV